MELVGDLCLSRRHIDLTFTLSFQLEQLWRSWQRTLVKMLARPANRFQPENGESTSYQILAQSWSGSRKSSVCPSLRQEPGYVIQRQNLPIIDNKKSVEIYH